MATRTKRSRTKAGARKTRRASARKDTRARKAAAAVARPRRASRVRSNRPAAGIGAAARSAAPIVRRSVRPISTGWSTLRVLWRPAISMATLPYRLVRVYRWAEAESSRSSAAIGAP
jgi:hypothetical protein